MSTPIDLPSDCRAATRPGAIVTARAGGLPQAGPRMVSLWVTDDHGASALVLQTVTVAPAPEQPIGVKGVTAVRVPPRLPQLQATVRLRGTVTAGAVRVRLVTVQATFGSTIIVRCSGPGCPFRTARARTRSADRVVRIKRLQRRLRVGAIIRVMVTRPGSIGKYTRFRIRRGAAPDRRDLCLRHGSDRPFRCSRA